MNEFMSDHSHFDSSRIIENFSKVILAQNMAYSKKLILVLLSVIGLSLVSATPVSKKNGLRLIKTGADEPPKWLDESEILELAKKDQGFIDITNLKNFPEKILPVSRIKGIPTTLRFQEEVKKAIADINSLRMQEFLNTFTDFYNRYMNSSNGIESEKWLYNQIYRLAYTYEKSYSGSLKYEEFRHDGISVQNSIIVRLEGADPLLQNERVILGAHQDSINTQNGTDYVNQYAPGADDNASGCVVLWEVLNLMLEHNIVPRRTIEFHWYAAEERGLLGSMHIAETYRTKGYNVTGMINYDVVGYHVPGNDDVAIITDYVDSELTQFLRILVDEYLTFGRRERLCNYACSDHASWTQYGFPAARPTQAVRNGQMHTIYDTIETVYLTQVAEFVKIGLGFAIELAEPMQLKLELTKLPAAIA